MDLAFTIPDWGEVWRIIFTSLIMSISAFIIIRFSGKKSISKITLPQMVIMISLGSIVSKPLNDSKTIIGTILSLIIFVAVLLLLDILTMKFDKIEPLFDSVPTILIKDGEIQTENLKKMRITVDQLESLIRQKGLSSIKDLRTVTLEIDGQFGYEEQKNYSPTKQNLFDELRTGKHITKVDKNLD